MSLKKGDRVRWTGRYDPGVADYAKAYGQLGTVQGDPYPLYKNCHPHAAVIWDCGEEERQRCDLSALCFVGNLERHFAVGDRVIYEGTGIATLIGKIGVIDHIYHQPHSGDFVEPRAAVTFDHEPARTRVVYFRNLRLKKEEIMINIKQIVKDTIALIVPKTTEDKDALALELLVSSAISTVSEKRKKDAKAAAIKGELILDEYRPGEVEAYRSAKFVVTAKTSEPAQRLDQAVLRAELSKAGLSKAKIDKAFVAALTDNKAATKIEVVQL